jgi:hypothetical protein
MFFVERADQLLGVEHVVALHDLNIAGGDFAFLVYGQRKLPWLMIVGFKLHLLEVEDDIGNVFDHPWKSGKLMLCAGNFYCSDGRAFQRGKQDAPERISDGVSVAGFKRLSGELGVSICGSALVFDEGLRHFKTTITYWHISISDLTR